MAEHRSTHDAEAIMRECEPAIRGIIKRKLGVTLSPSDGRAENLDAENLYSDVRLVLIESINRLDSDSSGDHIRNLRGYIAKATYNACSEYLRKKYPYRQSLKNRLHYFFNHSPDPALAIWEDGAGELLCGFVGWRGRPIAQQADRLNQLRDNPRIIGPAATAANHLDNMKASDWASLLHSIFKWVEMPLELDDLVNVVADLMGIQDGMIAIDGEDDDGQAPIHREPHPGLTPEQEGYWSEFLRQLWAEVCRLTPNHRIAYLLNLTDAEGDIQVLTMKGIASITQIGRAINLSDEQFQVLWQQLPMDAESRRLAYSLATYDEKFAMLWIHLPLDDNTIAKIIGGTRQQVINLRKGARLRLRRQLEVFS